jgi:glycosyltransferase involved in cell wall biosynthesis
MPVYDNPERYLREAMDSILKQTLSDFEFIIVDDASTDGTARVLASYSDPRIVVLTNPSNMHETNSLNRGLGAARGEYIACIDHDDVAEPNRLARQVDYLDSHPEVAVLGTWITPIDNEGNINKSVGPFSDPGLLGALYPSASAWSMTWMCPLSPGGIAWCLTWLCPLCHSSVMMRRDVVQRVGGYDPRFDTAEDYDLWTRIVQAGGTVAIIQERLVRYRFHEGQVSYRRKAQQELLVLRIAQRYNSWLLGIPLDVRFIRGMYGIYGVYCGASGLDWNDPAYYSYVALLESTVLRSGQKFGKDHQALAYASKCLLKVSARALLEGFPLKGFRVLAMSLRLYPRRVLTPLFWLFLLTSALGPLLRTLASCLRALTKPRFT